MGLLHKINGDFVEYCQYGEIDIAVQNCNCFNVMGAGLALGVKDIFPMVLDADRKTLRGSKLKLGGYSKVEIERRDKSTITFYNIYGQYRYSRTYQTFQLDRFMEGLSAAMSNHRNPRVLMPYVGCGLAQGDSVELIHRLEELVSRVDCTIYLVNYDTKIRKLIVAGSREFQPKRDNPYNFVRKYLDKEYAKKPFIVVSGKARGPDIYGYKWSERNDQLSLNFPAIWVHKGSGHVRNAIMGTIASEAFVFWDGESSGSKDMIAFMNRKGKPVTVIGEE